MVFNLTHSLPGDFSTQGRSPFPYPLIIRPNSKLSTCMSCFQHPWGTRHAAGCSEDALPFPRSG